MIDKQADLKKNGIKHSLSNKLPCASKYLNHS